MSLTIFLLISYVNCLVHLSRFLSGRLNSIYFNLSLNLLNAFKNVFSKCPFCLLLRIRNVVLSFVIQLQIIYSLCFYLIVDLKLYKCLASNIVFLFYCFLRRNVV